jgi:macrolide transport system ATP-binding/permease protein
VYRLILREASWLTAVGIGAGLVFAVIAATLMRGLLFGVASWDLPTLVVVSVVLGICSLCAA